MPTYGYRCNRCDHTFEVFQRITEDPLTECEKCGGEVRRLLYPVGIVFKGSGFHINDYAGTGSKAASASDKSESTPSAEAPKDDSK